MYAVRPNPTAAVLENDGVGQRSGTSPLDAFVVSQNQRKVRCWTSFRNSASVCGVPPPFPFFPLSTGVPSFPQPASATPNEPASARVRASRPSPHRLTVTPG